MFFDTLFDMKYNFIYLKISKKYLYNLIKHKVQKMILLHIKVIKYKIESGYSRLCLYFPSFFCYDISNISIEISLLRFFYFHKFSYSPCVYHAKKKIL